jgi:hypothetical protein
MNVRRQNVMREPMRAAASSNVAPEPSFGPLQRRFLVLDTVGLSRASQQVTCRVRLLRAGEALAGEASEIDSEAGRVRAAVRATLEAATQAVDGVRFGLEGAARTDVGGHPHVAVRLEATDRATPRQVHRLSGVAEVQQSAPDAACLATLAAVDRWLAGRSVR